MSKARLNARIIGKVSGRRRLSTSATRARLPIAGSRSRRDNCFCSIMNRIALIGSGAAQPQLPIHTLSKFSIPVPKTLADQKRIVDRLRAISSESKRLEGIYQQKHNALEELRQAILQKAFAGELTARAVEDLHEAAQ